MTVQTFPKRRDDGTATVVAIFKGVSPVSEVDDALAAWRETLAGVDMTEDLAGDPTVRETNDGFEIQFEIQPQSRYWRDWVVALISAIRERLGDGVFEGFHDAVAGRTHRAALDHLDGDAGD